MAFGLEEVFAKSPWEGTIIEEVVKEGIPAITPEIGGGGDFFRSGSHQIAACARGITNVMKLMGILDGQIETETNKAIVWDGHTEVLNDAQGGVMTLVVERGQTVKKGDLFGIKYDPTTGDELGRVYSPADGTLLKTGLIWPLCRNGKFLGVLGDKLEEVDLATHRWSF